MFKRKNRESEIPPAGFSAADFAKTAETQNAFVEKLKAPPTIVEKLEADLKNVEEMVKIREDELRTLNSKALELSYQIEWLKRTPQAMSILTALIDKFSEG